MDSTNYYLYRAKANNFTYYGNNNYRRFTEVTTESKPTFEFTTEATTPNKPTTEFTTEVTANTTNAFETTTKVTTTKPTTEEHLQKLQPFLRTV